MNDSATIQRIFHELERAPMTVRSIDELAHAHGIRRRAVYDFVSICSVFGMCKRTPNNHVEWHGVDRWAAKVNAIRTEAEQEPGGGDIRALFNYHLDASLQHVACGLVKLFFFLRVKFLDLRQVSRLFAQRNTKYKTMLRKVYTVASGLEIAGIVRKTRAVSEIQLNVSLDSEISETGLNISSILNSRQQIEQQKLGERRRREFEAACTELREGQRLPEVNSYFV
jgi:hypothetical protein